MKKLFLAVILSGLVMVSFAQNDDNNLNESDNRNEIRTLMGQNNAMGGYAGLTMQYARIDDRDAYLFGIRGGALIGHLMTMGVAGYGFFNDVKYNATLGYDLRLAGGYGGFFFEPILMPKMPVHVAFPVMIGAGGVAVVSSNDNSWWEKDLKSRASDAFMIIQPGVEVEMNVTKFFRFCVGGYYRYTSDINIENPDYAVDTDIMRDLSVGVTFKFGRF
jgi:hypothetical protein